MFFIVDIHHRPCRRRTICGSGESGKVPIRNDTNEHSSILCARQFRSDSPAWKFIQTELRRSAVPIEDWPMSIRTQWWSNRRSVCTWTMRRTWWTWLPRIFASSTRTWRSNISQSLSYFSWLNCWRVCHEKLLKYM